MSSPIHGSVRYMRKITPGASVIEMKRGEEYDEEYRIVRPDREVRWIRANTAVPVRDASGRSAA